MEERKEEAARSSPTPFEQWEAAGRESAAAVAARGGRVAVTVYCLSSVCCGSSLGAHSPRPQLFISSQYPCRRRQAAVVFIIAYIMKTRHRGVCLLGECCFYYRVSHFHICKMLGGLLHTYLNPSTYLTGCELATDKLYL